MYACMPHLVTNLSHVLRLHHLSLLPSTRRNSANSPAEDTFGCAVATPLRLRRQWPRIASNGRMTVERSIRNDLRRSGRGIIETLSRYLPSGSQEITKTLSVGIAGVSNPVPPQYRPVALTLRRDVSGGRHSAGRRER
jgi:hypothetical protein